MNRPPAALRAAEVALLAAVTAWLAWAAATIQVEPFDGLASICNSHHLLGRGGIYLPTRSPGLPLWLLPAEWLKLALRLHPLDLRLHHASMALLNLAYLLSSYWLIARLAGRSWTSLIAAVSALLSFVFFSYAPFVSHDIVPGVLLLLMLVAAEQYVATQRWRWWWLLVIAGTAAALVKGVFLLFWLALGIARALPTLLRRAAGQRTSWRALSWLAAGATLSVAATWLFHGLALASWRPDLPLLLRPWQQFSEATAQYAGTGVVFPWWVYLRNADAYGWLTALLIVPALIHALRGDRLPRSVAVAWLVGAALMQAIGLREVRYLAFLAPCSALLIALLLRRLLVVRWRWGVVAAVLVVDCAVVTVEAAHYRDPFFQIGTPRQFLEPVTALPSSNELVFVNHVLSFRDPAPSPLAGDRFHRWFHVSLEHVQILSDLPLAQMAAVPDLASALTRPRSRAGDLLAYSSRALENDAIAGRGQAAQLATPFRQFIAVVETLPLAPAADGRPGLPAGAPAVIDRSAEGSTGALAVLSQPVADWVQSHEAVRLHSGASLAETWNLAAVDTGTTLWQRPAGAAAGPATPPTAAGPATQPTAAGPATQPTAAEPRADPGAAFELVGYRVLARCDERGCRRATAAAPLAAPATAGD